MSLEGSFEPRDRVYFSNVLRKTVPYDRRTNRERTRSQGGPCARNCQQTRVARTQGTFRLVTVYEAGQVCGLLGSSDLVCQRGDLEGNSFPDREPVQFLQYRRDVFVSTTANYQASQCVLSTL